MNIAIASEIIREAIQTVLIVSMPSVGLGLLVGLIISIFQAVTQIQEQTLTFVPKMIVVLLVIAFTFGWMQSMLLDLAFSLWEHIPEYSK
ncbi:MAG: flagellar biosynthesis protein FliQ [Candidatus Margulisbacteria bacterium]|nr:flagellar biosynthesis protein FliQ [Candidatus Margulisiibacteriota bacterium]